MSELAPIYYYCVVCNSRAILTGPPFPGNVDKPDVPCPRCGVEMDASDLAEAGKNLGEALEKMLRSMTPKERQELWEV